jgi:hypothetical protein
LDPIAKRRQLKLVPFAGGFANDADVVEVVERFAAPEAKRLAKQAAGLVVVRRSQSHVTAICQVAEPVNVKCRRWQSDDVAAFPSGNLDVRPEQAAQPRDVALERRDRLGRWPPIPYILDQAIARYAAIGVEQEQGEHCALALAAKSDWAALDRHFH